MKKAQAGNWIMVFPFLFALTIIGFAIWYGISLFFENEYEIKENEAVALSYKIEKCFSKNEFDWSLPEEQLQKIFLETCRLNKRVIENDFYIDIYDENFQILFGKGDNTKCGLSGLNENFPFCVESSFNSIKIKVGSNQHLRRKLA